MTVQRVNKFHPKGGSLPSLRREGVGLKPAPSPPNQPMPSTSEEAKFLLLRRLAAEPDASQRQLARDLHISLGKLNYCLQSLIDKGWVKAGNFSRSSNKKGYAYLLTPSGIEAKARLTVAFLQYKMQEYDQLKQEIEILQQEIQRLKSIPSSTPITGAKT